MPIEPIEFEDELGDALRRTADTFQPEDSRGLVAEGHAYGRRLRRRRTAAITAGVAAFALIGVGGALVGGLAGGDGSGRVAAAPTKPAPTSHPEQSSSSAKPARPGMTAKQVMDVFLSTLPKGHIQKSTWTNRGTEEGIPLATVIFDNGLVIAGVGRDEAVAPCPETPDPDPNVSCTTTRVHGGTLTISKGYEYPDHRAETKNWSATFLTASGASVSLSEWNSRDEKDAPISRPNPPLSSAQLAKIATDPRWQRVIDALPDPNAVAPDTSSPKTSGKFGV
ncbi:hypothetical protein [Streptomyces sp. CBMA29]|uniref:hypothetical protein n=1 Tax=Streptomyces sp. CBMA29 TaxID=1896314 RepID=UPI0016618AF2|nr:hypothetical protein [Streptomyces sp. CBMA29]MBD0740376.1 hypothetical protein [Streptomyces sp. CBMA29]